MASRRTANKVGKENILDLQLRGAKTVCRKDQSKEASQVGGEKRQGCSPKVSGEQGLETGLSEVPPGSNIPHPPSSKCGSPTSRINIAWERWATFRTPSQERLRSGTLPYSSFYFPSGA